MGKHYYYGGLHNHTQFSNLRLRDCIIKENELIDYAIKLGHKLVAITDHESISNAIKVEEYYDKIKKDNPDFKLIRGNEIYLCRNGLNGQNFVRGQDKYFHFVLALLLLNKQGILRVRYSFQTFLRPSK